MAWDIDLSLLEVGSNGGPYSERSMQLVEPALRQQYFHTEDKRWYISEEIRKLVSFRYINLNKIGETLRGREFDLVFCRNVLIYFDAPSAHAALHAVTRLLSPEGHLIIGHSEGTLAQEAGLTPQIVNGCLAIPAAALREAAHSTPESETAADHPLHYRTRMSSPAHATTSVTERSEHGEEWHPLPDLIRNARMLISDGRLEDARRELKHVLLRDRTSPDARYLLGMLHLGSGELHDALGEFERIISWHETHAMARLQAALVLGRLGNIQAAESHRQRLLDILAHSPDDELIDQEEGITVGFARLLCMNPFDTHTTN
jgi:chemotaxis protein methyltransferase WspC